jgi:hypothetical protein
MGVRKIWTERNKCTWKKQELARIYLPTSLKPHGDCVIRKGFSWVIDGGNEVFLGGGLGVGLGTKGTPRELIYKPQTALLFFLTLSHQRTN